MFPIKNQKWRNLFILIVGFTLFISFFELVPRFGNLLEQTWNLYSDSKQVEKKQEIDYKINEAKVKNKELKLVIETIVSDYEKNLKISSIISSVDNIALDTKVKILGVKPGNVEKKENLWLQAIEFHLQGTYENFYNLTRLLEHSDKVILLKSIILKPIKNSKTKLDILLQVDVYLNL